VLDFLKKGHFLRKMEKGHFQIENTEEDLPLSTRKPGRAPKQLSVIEVGTMANALDAVINF
jgi:hypothetical protein